MSATPNHFGHREANGVVVDLFWDREDLEHEFRVEVEDRRERTHFVLFPTTGKDAVRAFHHPCPTGATAGRGRDRLDDRNRRSPRVVTAMPIPVHIETLHNPIRYTYTQIETAYAIAWMLNRGKLVLVEPPRW